MTEHLVYPDGPSCQPNCPGPSSMYHDGYADGFERAEAEATAAAEQRLRDKPAERTWPSRDELEAMSADEMNAFLASRGLDVRVAVEPAGLAGALRALSADDPAALPGEDTSYAETLAARLWHAADHDCTIDGAAIRAALLPTQASDSPEKPP